MLVRHRVKNRIAENKKVLLFCLKLPSGFPSYSEKDGTSKTVVVNDVGRVDLSVEGYFTESGDIFDCHHERDECATGIWWVEVRMPLNILQSTGQSLTTKNHLAQSVGTEVEKDLNETSRPFLTSLGHFFLVFNYPCIC